MQIGFVGLGAMGSHMARNLAQAGLLRGVWNRTAEKATALAAELKCHAFVDLIELATNSEAVVICVSADEDVRAVVAGLEPALSPRMIVMDCSTVSAGTARDMHARLSPLGVGFLDCPVSGGVEGARTGSLAIMVGGDAEDYSRAVPVLEKMGKTIAHMGPSGAGQATKATNQIMCAGIEVLGKGAGSSWYFVNRAPFMARQSYPAGFKVRLHAKDLRICRDMAAQHGARLPIIDSTLKEYAALVVEGFGDEDISAIYRLKSKLFPDAKPAAP